MLDIWTAMSVEDILTRKGTVPLTSYRDCFVRIQGSSPIYVIMNREGYKGTQNVQFYDVRKPKDRVQGVT
jgi:hypothetical protein